MVEEKKVPKGYKMTEVGIIPEDWEIKTLSDVAKINMGQSPSSEFYNTKEIGLPLIQGNADVNGRKTIDRVYTSQTTKKCSAGDIIMSVRAPVGKIAKARYDSCIGRGVCAISSSNDFLYHYLILIEDTWTSISKGSTFDSINSEDIKNLKIAHPSLQEQQAIAEALSDVDNLITSLEKLIDKKRQIKQGTMQQLLTGKKRLPGFTGEWGVKKLGDIGRAYSGLTKKNKSDFEDGNKPYISFLNVMNNAIIRLQELKYVKVSPSEKQSLVQKGDLFFNTSSETPDEVGMCSVLMEDVDELYLNSFCFGFRLFKKDEFEPLYLSYYFRSNEGRKLFYFLAQGATRYNLSKSAFYKMKITYPSFEEQMVISMLLYDMDSEIEALEKKLEKYKAIKQGMMQELLTGRIRLV